MFFAGRMALIVEVMKQRGGGIEVQQGLALVACEPQPVGFRFAVCKHAGLHGQRVFAQALALSPFLH